MLTAIIVTDNPHGETSLPVFLGFQSFLAQQSDISHVVEIKRQYHSIGFAGLHIRRKDIRMHVYSHPNLVEQG